MVLQRRVLCMCIRGLKTIYIQVAYLPVPGARSHPTPTCLNTTTHKSLVQKHLVFVLYLFITLILDDFYTKVIISGYTFACSHLPCSCFSFAISPPYACYLCMCPFLMNSPNVPLSHFLTLCLHNMPVTV